MSNNYKPFKFFLISLLLAALAWLSAAYVSYQPHLQQWLFPLIIAGMSSPTLAALFMLKTSNDKRLWVNFLQRLRFKIIKPNFLPLIVLFMPCIVLFSIATSLVFGGGYEQFSLTLFAADNALENMNFITILLIIALSCTLEEMGWRGYGIESLNSKFNLWHTSLIFATLWSLWHVPAFFINKGYFQQEVWNKGMLYVLTYFLTLYPVTFLINWAYVKNNRSILIAILSHITLNVSVAFFPIQPITKIILMLLLLLTAAIVVLRDKKLFFEQQ